MVRKLNLKNFLDEENLRKKIPSIRKVLFFRICGTGMGACSILFKSMGFDVFGCDKEYFPPMSEYLLSSGIHEQSLDKVNEAFLQQFDLIVVGNSLPRNNEFAEIIENSGTPFTSFPVALGEMVLKNYTVIGISGTHGKTTTSYFLKQMLNHLGIDCGYLIGGILENEPPARIGSGKKGEYFVIEADEYDTAYFQKHSKFHHYNIFHCIVTSLEFDHADIFNSIDDIKNEFKRLFLTLNEGSIIYNSDYPALSELINEMGIVKAQSYSGKKVVQSVVEEGRRVVFTEDSFLQEKVHTNIFGQHNIENILSCFRLLRNLGFEESDLIKSVENLKLVKRRQEIRGAYNNSIIIDDFAHHPTAIQKTISAIKSQYRDYQLVSVYEPISATARSDIFQIEYQDCFAGSEEVVLIDNQIKTTVSNHETLDHQSLRDGIDKNGISTKVIHRLDELIKYFHDKSDE
ncbi:Mur ligase family protein, partial [Bacteriovoracaceae bacterium]|nr:Mur ligase family protein [Bacteriovoracaceae bacterium]